MPWWASTILVVIGCWIAGTLHDLSMRLDQVHRNTELLRALIEEHGEQMELIMERQKTLLKRSVGQFDE